MTSILTRRTLAALIACLIAAPLAAQDASADATAPLRLQGLRAAGTIAYDSDGVPRITAADENDAAYLLGYAHARDRMFQMDLSRRAAQGRVAELLGAPALANDVQTRTLGLDRAARRSWSDLSADTRGWLRAYAMGVNAWLDSNPTPAEYGLLELTQVERWSPLDSVVLAKLLSFQLAFNLDIDFTLRLAAYQKAGQAGGFDGAKLFFEDTHRTQPADDRITYPELRLAAKQDAAEAWQSQIAFDPVTLDLASAYRARIATHPLLAPALESVNRRGGSNTWVIGGRHTRSGRPIFANDPHLPLGVPNTFYQAHVVGGGTLDVNGFGLPGTPVMAFGCTPRHCWGVTTNHMDVTDVYDEQLVLDASGLPTHTVFRGAQEPVQRLTQDYRVNKLDGVPDNAQVDPSIGPANGGVTVIVPRRNFGPLVQMANGRGLSVQFTGWGATLEMEGLRMINRARDVEDMREAVSLMDFGSVNITYADVEGNIAGFVTGEQPLRDDLQNLERPDGAPPFLIRDGSGAKRHEWLPVARAEHNQALPYAIVPIAEMPGAVNPVRGYIANSNNDPIGNTLDNSAVNDRRNGGGVLYLAPYYSTFRVGRIDRLIQAKIAAGDKIDYETARNWQGDHVQLDAQLLLPYLLAASDRAAASGAWEPLAALQRDTRVADAIARLRGWNFSTPTGIKEGFDAGDDADNLPEPTRAEAGQSVAATLYAGWRAQIVREVIDGTLQRAGVVASQAGAGGPSGERELLGALKFHLDGFAERRGFGASGLDFFVAAGAPSREDARDFVLLRGLQQALDRFASEEMAPAFAGSRELDDYRWGRLHRITLRHTLRGPFDIPSAQGLHGFTSLSPQLPGLSRDGGYETLNDGEHDIRAVGLNGFAFAAGTILRYAADFAGLPRAESILTGGQSGNLMSPNYVSQYRRWLTNRYRPMALGGEDVGQPATTLEFAPFR